MRVWSGSLRVDLTDRPRSHNVLPRRRDAAEDSPEAGSGVQAKPNTSHLNRGGPSARHERPRDGSVGPACVGAGRSKLDLQSELQPGKFDQVAPDAARESVAGARLMFENSTVCHIVDELITRPMSISLGLVGLVPLVVIDNSRKRVLIPDMTVLRMGGGGKFWRWRMSSRPISLLVR